MGRSGSRDPSQDTLDPQERGGETLGVPTEAKQTEIRPGSSACWTWTLKHTEMPTSAQKAKKLTKPVDSERTSPLCLFIVASEQISSRIPADA